MVPAANGQCSQAADNISDDVIKVKVAAVGQETLQEFGADAQAKSADDEGKVKGASAIGVGDPIEDDS